MPYWYYNKPVSDVLKKFFLLIFILVAAAGLSLHKYDDPDYYFHVASGKYIVNHGLPEKYPFTFTYKKDWRDHEWLAQVVIYGFDRVLGSKAGPFLFTFVFLSLTMVLMLMAGWVSAPKSGGGPRAGPLLMILLLLPVRDFIGPRPYMIAIALAAATIYFLERLKHQRIVHWFLFLVIAAVWANVHGSFLTAFGFVFAFLFVQDSNLRKKVVWIMLAVAVGFLLNPYYFHIFSVPVQHFVSAMVTTFPGAEWEPWSFGANPWLDILFLLIFLASLLSFIQPKVRRFLPEFIIVVFYMLMAAKAQRFAFNAAVLAVPLALGVVLRPNRMIEYLGPVGAGLGVLFALLMVPVQKRWIGLDMRDFPVSAVRVCESLPKKGTIRVFNPFSSGGYIVYAGFPRLKTVIDGQVYVAGFQKIGWFTGLLARPGDFVTNMDKLRVDCIIVDSTKPRFFGAVNALFGTKSFSLVHIDDHFGVYMRKGLKPENIRVYKALRPMATPTYLMRLSNEESATAKREAGSILKSAPVYSGLTMGVLALKHCLPDLSPQSLAKRGTCGQTAQPYFDRLVELRPSTGLFHYLRAGAMAMQGHTGAALLELSACDNYPACRGLKMELQQKRP